MSVNLFLPISRYWSRIPVQFWTSFFCAGIFLPNGLKTISLICLLAYFLQGQKRAAWWQHFRKDYFSLAFAFFFLITAISGLWSENKTEFLSELQSKIPFLAVALVLNRFNTRINSAVKPFLISLYWAGILISVGCLIRGFFFSGKSLAESLVYEELASFSSLQPIYLSLFLILSSIAWYTLQQKNELPRAAFHRFAPVFFYLMVVQLSSRTELMVYTGGVFFVLFRHFREHLGKLIAVLGGFAFLTVLLICLDKTNLSRYREMLDFQQDYKQNVWGGRSLRLEKWKNTWECYQQFPLLGTGAGDCSDELQRIYKKNTFDIAYNAQYNPHNQYLQTLLTLGPVGLFLFLSAFLIAFRRAYHKSSFVLFLLTYAFAASMITESMLERQTGVFLFTIILGFFACADPEKSGLSGAFTEPVQ